MGKNKNGKSQKQKFYYIQEEPNLINKEGPILMAQVPINIEANIEEYTVQELANLLCGVSIKIKIKKEDPRFKENGAMKQKLLRAIDDGKLEKSNSFADITRRIISKTGNQNGPFVNYNKFCRFVEKDKYLSSEKFQDRIYSVGTVSTQPKIKLKPRNKRHALSNQHKKEIREIAKKKWKNNKTITIAGMGREDEIINVSAPHNYSDNFYRNCLKDLAPSNKPGRRKE